MSDSMQPAGAPRPSLDIGTAVGYGWKKFTEYAGPLILIILVVVLVQLVFAIVRFQFDSLVMQLVFSLVGFVIGQILLLGIYRAALMITDGVTPELGKVFSTDRLGDYIVASILYSIAVGIGLVLCVIPGLILAVLFAFYPYYVLDANMGAVESLSASWNLVTANAGAAIGLLVVAWLLFVVGIVLCGIGLLVTGPVALLMTAYGYKVLNNKPVTP